VRESLSAIGVQGITVTEVKGFGRQNGTYRVVSRDGVCGRLSAQVKIEAAIKSEMLDQVIEAIEKSAIRARSATKDFRLRFSNKVVRIRTAETGAEAL